MKVYAWVLLFLALGAMFVDVTAQDDDVDDDEIIEEDIDQEDEEEEYGDEESAHQVSTNYLLPKYADNRFPIGKETTILVDVSNNGEDVFNVTRMGVFLQSPYDLNYYIQNCTVKELSGVAAPNAQISLEYKFTPDARLEALEFWFSGFVEYTMEGSDEPHRQIFVNTTVHLFDDKDGFDYYSAFTSLLMVAVLASFGYLAVMQIAAKSGFKKKKKKKAVVRPAEAAEWEVEAYQQRSSSKRVGRKRISKK